MTAKSVANRKQALTAILHWEEDVYVAECPEVGTASQGETVEEALANLKEATELYLEDYPMFEASPRPISTINFLSYVYLLYLIANSCFYFVFKVWIVQ